MVAARTSGSFVEVWRRTFTSVVEHEFATFNFYRSEEKSIAYSVKVFFQSKK